MKNRLSLLPLLVAVHVPLRAPRHESPTPIRRIRILTLQKSLRQPEQIAFQRAVDVCRKKFATTVRAGHPGHACGNEGIVQDLPASMANHGLVWANLAREEPVVHLNWSSRLNPFRQRRGGFGVDDNRSARPLTLGIFSVQVKARQARQPSVAIQFVERTSRRIDKARAHYADQAENIGAGISVFQCYGITLQPLD